MWKLILETEHGKLFQSEKGSLKCQIKCSECGCLIEGIHRDSIGKIHARQWVTQGNPYAVCKNCDPASSWKPIE